MITFKQYLNENYSYYGIYFVISLGKEMTEEEIVKALKQSVGHAEGAYIHGLRRKGDLKDMNKDLISDLSDDPEVVARAKVGLQAEKKYPRGHEVHADLTVRGRPVEHASFEHAKLSNYYKDALERAFGYDAHIRIFDGE